MLPPLSLLPDKCDLLEAQQAAEGRRIYQVETIRMSVILITWSIYHRGSLWKGILIKYINLVSVNDHGSMLSWCNNVCNSSPPHPI